MALKIYGHPWSLNTRKTLMTVAEHGAEAELVLVMVPKGEHKQPAHVARHPWGKVPTIDDGGFALYETRAINAYLDRTLSAGGPRLLPIVAKALARLDQWTNIADAYFIPHAQPFIVESLFRRFLGGEQNQEVILAAREGMKVALDAADRWLATTRFFAGEQFTLADVHWMPYLEYLPRIGEGDAIAGRKHLDAWWNRVSSRPTWQKVARTGPQPYDPGMTADVIEKQYR
jgi:glutathione S-transferase